MNWNRLKREITPRRIFNLTKLGFLNYLQWPLGAMSYFIIIYQLGLKYLLPQVTIPDGLAIFGGGIAVSYTIGLSMKLHKKFGLYRDEQEMITEANPYARFNYEITLRGIELTIAMTEANIKWLKMEGVPTEEIEAELVAYRAYQDKVRGLLQSWG